MKISLLALGIALYILLRGPFPSTIPDVSQHYFTFNVYSTRVFIEPIIVCLQLPTAPLKEFKEFWKLRGSLMFFSRG